jgi:hypothetical protein
MTTLQSRFWSSTSAAALSAATLFALANSAVPASAQSPVVPPAVGQPVPDAGSNSTSGAPTDPASSNGKDTTPTAATAPLAGADASLSAEQAKLAGKYKELERVILRMAEVMQTTDPKRAALLRQAFAQSKQRQIDLQYEDVVKLLQQEQLYQASKGQVAMQQDLDQLLQLLLSGEREKQIPNERAEIKRFIDRINKLIREEQGLQGETEGQGDAGDLIKQQDGIANKTGELVKDLNKFDVENNPTAGGKESSGPEKNGAEKGGAEKSGKGNDKSQDQKGEKPTDTQSGDKKADGKNSDSKKSDEKSDSLDPSGKAGKSSGKANDKSSGKSDQKSTQQKPDDSKSDDQQKSDDKSGDKSGKSADGKPPQDSDGQPQDGKSQKGQSQKSQSQKGQSQGQQGEDKDNDAQPQDNPSGEQQSSNDESPARKRIQQAEERMRSAKRKLEQAERRGAADQQQRAVEELKQAKAELEEILRQLREEQIEHVLAQLEGRFRKMLQMQVEVYEGTIGLDRIPDDERDRDVEIEAGKLSRRENEITVEADKTLALLHEEGSSVAFPESVDQMREDMVQTTARLARANVGQITQGVEQDIVKALEEMVAALQKAQKDQRERRGGGGGGGQGQRDQPLLDSIAELKMIRALQMRVNTRTERYSKLLQDGSEQAEAPDLVEAVQRLSQREERIYRTTRDIVVGKNK